MSKSSLIVWHELSPHARFALLDDPHGAVPGEYVPEIAQHGGEMHMAYWVAADNPPAGFRLRTAQADVIAGWKDKLTHWWEQLPEDVRAIVVEKRGRQIPIAHKDAVFEPNLVGGVTTGTVGATEPAGEFFDLAPVAQDFVEWKVARGLV